MTISEQLRAITDGENHPMPNLCNAAAVLWDNLKDINWCGFYMLIDDMLVLGPFQGRPACIRIPIGRGVCGTTAKEMRTHIVPNVHEFPGHIACDTASNSEIVVPMIKNGKLLGVLDIDSPVYDRFTEEERIELEACADVIVEAITREY